MTTTKEQDQHEAAHGQSEAAHGLKVATHDQKERLDMTEKRMQFSVVHAGDRAFESDGLRPFFLYKDLGIREATAGAAIAHVIKAKPGTHAQPTWHHHEVGFQMVYILNGWVRFEYEGVGEVRLEAGSCVHQPPGIRHRELEHSEDLELIEIVLPAEFKTVTET